VPAERTIPVPKLLLRNGRPAIDEPAFRDQPDKRTSGERAAAEPEDIDFVLVVVVLDQPIVRLPDILRDADAECSAADPIQEAGSDSFIVVGSLEPLFPVASVTLPSCTRFER
jgi:hypothetical protein